MQTKSPALLLHHPSPQKYQIADAHMPEIAKKTAVRHQLAVVPHHDLPVVAALKLFLQLRRGAANTIDRDDAVTLSEGKVGLQTVVLRNERACWSFSLH